MKRLDRCLLVLIERCMQFLNDWAGVSQDAAELFLARVCGILVIPMCLSTLLDVKMGYFDGGIVAVWTLGWTLWTLGTMRDERRRGNTSRRLSREAHFIIRIGWIGLIGFDAMCGVLPPHSGFVDCYFISATFFALFRTAALYVNVCFVDGDRARKTKLAWQKLKELFGTEWMPAPVPAAVAGRYALLLTSVLVMAGCGSSTRGKVLTAPSPDKSTYTVAGVPVPHYHHYSQDATAADCIREHFSSIHNPGDLIYAAINNDTPTVDHISSCIGTAEAFADAYASEHPKILARLTEKDARKGRIHGKR
ncbi:MAG TPA: hypothetical protein VFW94_23745 [Candidatus Acidoferrales bacterium]|nr:hypothetical protein [Candidatus Acidoferrales bacterium]